MAKNYNKHLKKTKAFESTPPRTISDSKRFTLCPHITKKLEYVIGFLTLVAISILFWIFCSKIKIQVLSLNFSTIAICLNIFIALTFLGHFYYIYCNAKRGNYLEIDFNKKIITLPREIPHIKIDFINLSCFQLIIEETCCYKTDNCPAILSELQVVYKDKRGLEIAKAVLASSEEKGLDEVVNRLRELSVFEVKTINNI